MSIKYKGFSMVEALIALTLMSVAIAASLPLMSKMSVTKTGVDNNVLNCITSTTTPTWYDTNTGDTTLPASGTECNAAILDTQYNRGKSLTTAMWYASQGTSDQKGMAKKILRASCDLGGEKACEYFINSCWKNGSASTPYCDDTTGFTDITYYLHQNRTTNTNVGATYIMEQIKGDIFKMGTNFTAEVNYSCTDNQSPNINQNLNDNLACEIVVPWMLITACNNGSESSCSLAHDKHYNQACTEVKTAWNTAPTGAYQLTHAGAAYPTEIQCNMASMGTAAITGCNANPHIDADCDYGYSNNYNRTCGQMFATWREAPSGIYNLTTAGASPTSPVAFDYIGYCDECVKTHGAKCADNSYFVDKYNDNFYFTTENDTSYTNWINTFTRDALVVTGVTNTTDGASNTQQLTTAPLASSADAPFFAAKGCDDLNTLGHTDWFLPAINELSRINVYRGSLPNLGTSYYWSSTENSLLKAKMINFGAGTIGEYPKNGWADTRCVRKEAAY